MRIGRIDAYQQKEQAAGGVHALDHDDHYDPVAVRGVRMQMVGERSVPCGYSLLDNDHQIPHTADDPDDADHGAGGEQGAALAVGDPESDQRACGDDRSVCDRSQGAVIQQGILFCGRPAAGVPVLRIAVLSVRTGDRFASVFL